MPLPRFFVASAIGCWAFACARAPRSKMTPPRMPHVSMFAPQRSVICQALFRASALIALMDGCSCRFRGAYSSSSALGAWLWRAFGAGAPWLSVCRVLLPVVRIVGCGLQWLVG